MPRPRLAGLRCPPSYGYPGTGEEAVIWLNLFGFHRRSRVGATLSVSLFQGSGRQEDHDCRRLGNVGRGAVGRRDGADRRETEAARRRRTRASGAMHARAVRSMPSGCAIVLTRFASRGRSISPWGGVAGVGHRRQRVLRLPQRLRFDGAGPRPSGDRASRDRTDRVRQSTSRCPPRTRSVVSEEFGPPVRAAAVAVRQFRLRRRRWTRSASPVR
jgi:hypothetical protein